MGLHWQYGVVQNASGAAFAVSFITDGSAPLVENINHAVPATGSTVAFISGAGTPTVPIWDLSVVATGGSGSYTYAWTNSEVGGSDTFNVYSVNSTGTTNAARYNTLAINGTIPASASDPPHDVAYEISCRVQDGAGGDITVTRTCAFVAIAI